jgi:NAD+ kinase
VWGVARIGFVVHPEREQAAALAAEAAAWLRSTGHEVRACEGPAPATFEGLDLVVSLGGDGTMLRTLELANPWGVPVLGVNLGRLGYLTEVEPSGLRRALERFLEGSYSIEERMTLEVEREDAEPEALALAVNEAVVEKSESGHTIRVALSIGGRPFLTYAADGLIVATPTGSTAYNLSARGPIASPTLRVVVVTPVSPHMLFDRSLVLDPAEPLRLELLDGRRADLIVDGRLAGSLRPGDAIVCRAGRRPARVVTFAPRDFHAILKAKFALPDR